MASQAEYLGLHQGLVNASFAFHQFSRIASELQRAQAHPSIRGYQGVDQSCLLP